MLLGMIVFVLDLSVKGVLAPGAFAVHPVGFAVATSLASGCAPWGLRFVPLFPVGAYCSFAGAKLRKNPETTMDSFIFSGRLESFFF